jgi:hypothetical protein
MEPMNIEQDHGHTVSASTPPKLALAVTIYQTAP